jgi:arsenate reductase
MAEEVSVMKKRVLFLCTGNSARSQLAEALFNHMCGSDFEAMSAGVHPSTIDPRVFDILQADDVDSSGLQSKSSEDYAAEHFDFVITLCDNAKDECAVFEDADAQIHWDFFDPKPLAGLKPFRTVTEGLKDRIALFLLLNGHEAENTVVPTALFKVMSDPLRLKILMLLEDEKALTVSELTKALEVSQPKVSRHLALLRDGGFLLDRREGLWIFYRLADHLPIWIRHTLETVRNGNPAIINQEKRNLKEKK